MSSKKRQLSREESEILEKKRKLENRLRLLQTHLQNLETGGSKLTSYARRQSPGTPLSGTDGSRTPTSTTRSRRVVHKPQKFDEKPPQVKLSGAIGCRCRNLLKGLMNHKFGWVFSEPVDPVKHNLPTYYKIIKRPMDLGTVYKQLIQGYYTDVDQFAGDVRLVWNNALTFNGKNDDVYKMAIEMSGFFEERFRKIPKGSMVRLPSSKKKKPGARKTPVQDTEFSSEIQRLKREVTAMKKTIKMYSGKGGSAKRPTSKALSWREKKTLKEDIEKLKDEDLEGVIVIIRTRMPQLYQAEDDEDFMLDMDQLNVPTLRDLQNYVRSIAMGRKKSSRTPNSASYGRSPMPARPPMVRHSSAPTQTITEESSSSSDSESSDSDSDSDSSAHVATKAAPGGGKKPKTSQANQPPANFGDPALFSTTPVVHGESTQPSQPSQQDSTSEVKMNSDAWSSFGDTPQEDQSTASGQKPGGEALWSDWQQKNLELKQKQKREEENAKREQEAREQAIIRQQQDEEEVKRLALERKAKEEDEARRRAEEATQQKQRELQAKREAARRAREEAMGDSVDLDEQRAAMAFKF